MFGCEVRFALAVNLAYTILLYLGLGPAVKFCEVYTHTYITVCEIAVFDFVESFVMYNR